MSVYTTEIARILANLVFLRGIESRICKECLMGNLPGMFSNKFFVLFLNISLGVCAACRLIDFTTQSLVEQILECLTDGVGKQEANSEIRSGSKRTGGRLIGLHAYSSVTHQSACRTRLRSDKLGFGMWGGHPETQ